MHWSAIKNKVKKTEKKNKQFLKKSSHSFKKPYKPQSISIQREAHLGAKTAIN